MMQAPGEAGGSASLPDAISFFERMNAKVNAQREVLEAKMEAKLVAQRAGMEARIAELMAPAPKAVSHDQLAALQARLEGLHAAKLLTDEELCSFEDVVGDFIDLTLSMAGQVISEQMIYSSPGQTFAAASKVHKLCGLSAMIAADKAFARQARRKCL